MLLRLLLFLFYILLLRYRNHRNQKIWHLVHHHHQNQFQTVHFLQQLKDLPQLHHHQHHQLVLEVNEVHHRRLVLVQREGVQSRSPLAVAQEADHAAVLDQLLLIQDARLRASLAEDLGSLTGSVPNNPLLRAARGIGMGMVTAIPALRRGFMRQAAGLSVDPMPRLLTGQPL